MIVYIIKHHTGTAFVANNTHPRKTTPDRQKAFRFGTKALAERCREAMPLPVAWEIVEATFLNGFLVEEERNDP